MQPQQILLLLKLLPFSHFKVQGLSMQPTFKGGENVITFNWVYFFRKPKMGEVVVVLAQDKLMLKRIKKVSAKKAFLVGDNPDSSTDSRDFGEVPISQIIGKVITS